MLECNFCVLIIREVSAIYKTRRFLIILLYAILLALVFFSNLHTIIGHSEFDLADIIGDISLTGLTKQIYWNILFSSGIIAYLISREFENNTIKTILTFPIKRYEVLTAKFAMALLLILSSNFLAIAIVLLLLYAIFSIVIPSWMIGVFLIFLSFQLILFSTCALLFSVITKNSVSTVIITFLIFVLWDRIIIVSQYIIPYSRETSLFLINFDPVYLFFNLAWFGYFKEASSLTFIQILPGACFMAITTIAFLLSGFYLFLRSDLY